jgi:predicted DNA-binding transcriptional regulator YafY
MVPWLLGNPGATLGELAARFEASEEEIAADLDVLGYCGLPGYGGGDLVQVTVFGDRVDVSMADFFRRPLRLTVREALTLLLAARAVAGAAALPEAGSLQSAAEKLEGALGADAGDPRVAVDLSAPGDEYLLVLRDAVASSRVVRLRYWSGSKAQETERDVEPWAVTGNLGSWYLQGYCRLAEGPRDFRLDRIRALAVTDERSSPTREPVPAPAYEPHASDEEVVLDLAPDAWWVAEWAVVDAVADAGEWRRVTLRVGAREWAARLALALAPSVRVVRPRSLAARVQTLAEATLARYGG